MTCRRVDTHRPGRARAAGAGRLTAASRATRSRRGIRDRAQPRAAARVSGTAAGRVPVRGARLVRGRRLPPRPQPRRASPGDLRSISAPGLGADVFCAGALVGETGQVVGVDFTDAQLARAAGLAQQHGIRHVQFVEANIDRLPFDDAAFDVVISNGVINLSPVKHRDVFADAARVLRPGGRLAIADIVSETPLKDTTRRNTSCGRPASRGAIPVHQLPEPPRRLRGHGDAPERLPLPHRPGARRLPGPTASRSLTIAATREGDNA